MTRFRKPALLAASTAALFVGLAHGADPFVVRYRIAVLPALGGSSSAGAGINDRGWATGTSNLAGDRTVRATLWRGGRATDLGALGGPGANSAVLWPVKNLRGIVAGITQTAEDDPLGERWSCYSFFPGPNRAGKRCVGFIWENGAMTELPTLGGTHGFAAGANNLGQVAGWAENRVRDPSCIAPQVLQFRAVLWGPGRGELRELPPLPGDSVSSATALNDRGQVVGISGSCANAVGGRSARRNVLWEHGRPVDIGDFGGIAWNTPMAINQHGDIVGFANRSAADGTAFNPRAFLKSPGRRIRNLGTLGGEGNSQALGVNAWRQVVGQSCDAAGACVGFLWQDGRMTDLNTLLSPAFHGSVVAANDIDDFGRITGQAVDAASGDAVAFVATPYLVRSP
ncbi:hypothetical protein [Luteimonas aquatica]|uniref:hypothetical protein n=1 Tax=Luteimonas aquatica TaxID=450364 RepID=UPI001F55EEFF|nr:hypothetical protein [Luteimonas aquatica]